ncbi:M48 family metallopeptidase [Telluribacter sp. SYSU D00476]|uniref:M48 family metallopeptidase n=1 Tax=Telluribacter sp. SYSU D00476 TaxID=2811430 RepID=UPI001FF34FB9|nr:M48 family metallopeptidase [Telluribacter sp. SYSU D00476]
MRTLARLFMGLIMVLVALWGYFTKTEVNPVTGEKQRVSLTAEEEVTLGVKSAPEMASQFGGMHPDEQVQQTVKRIGQRLVQESDAGRSPYTFNFHVLADPTTVNAFALPGGQIFITMGLLKRLKTEDQLAGVLGHEIGHVIGRHSAEQMAKQELMQGLAGGAAIALADPSSPATSAYIAQYVANIVGLKYGREDELESDEFGVKYMIQTGYDPNALLDVMRVLEQASGGQRQMEFLSTHPSPANRNERIRAAITKYTEVIPAGVHPQE